MDLREVWYAFRTAELERIAAEWLEESEIEYTREPESGRLS
jgi:hypothetical protein